MSAEANTAIVRRLIEEAQEGGVHEQIADDERVVTRKIFSGTHDGPFMGVPATGKPVSFDAIDILTIRGGLIREHRVVVDQLALLQQIGVR